MELCDDTIEHCEYRVVLCDDIIEHCDVRMEEHDVIMNHSNDIMSSVRTYRSTVRTQ